MTENEELALEVEELNAALELALRERDELLAERETDVRIVARVLAAQKPQGGVGCSEWSRSHEALDARFAGRIAELEQQGDWSA